jgi:hypothetical protein
VVPINLPENISCISIRNLKNKGLGLRMHQNFKFNASIVIICLGKTTTGINIASPVD